MKSFDAMIAFVNLLQTKMRQLSGFVFFQMCLAENLQHATNSQYEYEYHEVTVLYYVHCIL